MQEHGHIHWFWDCLGFVKAAGRTGRTLRGRPAESVVVWIVDTTDSRLGVFRSQSSTEPMEGKNTTGIKAMTAPSGRLVGDRVAGSPGC